jgi:hypothetical protein
MAGAITAVKDILRREERVLEKLLATIPTVTHKDTKITLREIVSVKRAEIKCYKAIIKASEKCPAVKKKAAKKKAVKKSAKCGAKKKACASKKKTAAKKKPSKKGTRRK